MLSLIAVVKKIFDFLKEKKYIILLILFFATNVMAFYMARSFYSKEKNDLDVRLRAMQNAHDVAFQKTINAYEKERQEREENIKKLESSLDSIQQKYEADKKALEDKKKEQIKKIITTYSEDPSGLAKEVSSVTGFQIVKAE